VAITRQLKALNVNLWMVGMTVGVDALRFYEVLGRDAEFVEAHKREFPGADLSNISAGAYGGCQILVEAIRRAGSLDSEKLRDAISKMDHNTVYGGFRVDRDGVQIGHRMVMFQWQDGKKVIVWPDELAPGKPRFPTPPWSQRP